MANLQAQIENKELHQKAEQLAKDYVDDFAESLLLQSKTLAVLQKADVVLSTHVDDARDIIIREQKRGWSREFFIIMGSALFGAFIQGFITELSAGRKALIAIYMIMGVAGMLMVFWALRK
jgi:hypothetical protein